MEKVIFINWQKDHFAGAMLTKTTRGIEYAEIGEELKGFYYFPFITSLLQEGALLQIYSNSEELIHLDIGFKKYEGPYAEQEYLEVRESVDDISLHLGLSSLNQSLANTTHKKYVKAYRSYDRVRYQ